MPLPGTFVIHPGWSAHQRPTVEGTLTARCDISRAGLGEGFYDPSTGQTAPVPAQVVATGAPCRVQPRNMGARTANVGERLLTFHTYQVTLEHDLADVRVDDRLVITQAPADLELVGRVLRVLDVAYGSEHWARNLTCEDELG